MGGLPPRGTTIAGGNPRPPRGCPTPSIGRSRGRRTRPPCGRLPAARRGGGHPPPVGSTRPRRGGTSEQCSPTRGHGRPRWHMRGKRGWSCCWT